MNQTSEFTLPAANLVSKTLPAFAAGTPTSAQVRLRAGEVLVQAGALLLGVITVKSGRLKRYRPYNRQPFLAGVVGPGESIGFEEILSNGFHRDTLEAVGETVVMIESIESVQSWLGRAPGEILQALRGQTSGLRPEQFLKKPMDLLPVRARVAATLWMLVEQHGRNDDGSRVLDLNLTREEVAHLAGTVYESVIRTLTSLKKEGVIDLNGRVIRILQEDQLARIGQIERGNTHVQDTVSENHSSPHNGSSEEAS